MFDAGLYIGSVITISIPRRESRASNTHLDRNTFIPVGDFDVMDPIVISPHIDTIRATDVSAAR